MRSASAAIGRVERGIGCRRGLTAERDGDRAQAEERMRPGEAQGDEPAPARSSVLPRRRGGRARVPGSAHGDLRGRIEGERPERARRAGTSPCSGRPPHSAHVPPAPVETARRWAAGFRWRWRRRGGGGRARAGRTDARARRSAPTRSPRAAAPPSAACRSPPIGAAAARLERVATARVVPREADEIGHDTAADGRRGSATAPPPSRASTRASSSPSSARISRVCSPTSGAPRSMRAGVFEKR